MVAQFTRDAVTRTNTIYTSAFLGDQISFNRLTLNVGLRWDRQVANLEEATVGPLRPPTCRSSARSSADRTRSARSPLPARIGVVTYNSVTPRLGLTYALNESRKTIARASYAIFASQLDSTKGSRSARFRPRTAARDPDTSTGKPPI